MNNIKNQFQDMADQAQAATKLWFGSARENIQASLDLAEKALDVRSIDQAKQFAETSVSVGRTNLERSLATGQQIFSEASELSKTQAQKIQDQFGQFGNGFSMPSLEAMFDPKTYGIDAKTFEWMKAPEVKSSKRK